MGWDPGCNIRIDQNGTNTQSSHIMGIKLIKPIARMYVSPVETITHATDCIFLIKACKVKIIVSLYEIK